MLLPCEKLAALPGEEIETLGAVFVAAAATVIVTELEFVRPPESATAAVIVCVPDDKLRLKLPPVPICPSMLDDHVRRLVRLPSCASDAEPENPIVAPEE